MSATSVPDSGSAASLSADHADIARQFVEARLAARCTPDYPGAIPQSMAESYAIQDIAIGLFPDEVVGWKVGGVPPAQQPKLGIHRLAGAIFARNVWAAPGDTVVPLPEIKGGFAAVESEFIARIGADADPAKTDWTIEEATAAVDKVFIGVELAGSPLSAINELGSAVVASDFGNNGGLMIGPEVENWRERLDGIEVETVINGASVGTGGSLSLAGGAMESVRFLLEHCARWGRPLKAGTLVSTGAVTGVHRVHAGDEAVCIFKGIAELHCSVVRAEPK
ncbi:2-keto-4-pentenoate hydratase [Brevundimonas intermedia]|uniref:2-keto-4-pentenoate hydratase n=1 Tax=Brevundimonas intermedia TaxID=74315 RepID=A0A4Y9RRH8_9CAUL|nr:fumarylacetoacetate hydrolase family protein [Brevundimonas intermedia]TFW10881.1 2-keto-4-pentenoate hydratase [Brevundimonas intermedia]